MIIKGKMPMMEFHDVFKSPCSALDHILINSQHRSLITFDAHCSSCTRLSDFIKVTFIYWVLTDIKSGNFSFVPPERGEWCMYLCMYVL